MDYLIEDFVNRQEELDLLWSVVRQETKQRILLIRGRDGMGKTYLLDEFRAECAAEGIDCIEYDFVENPDPDYLAVALCVYNKLGPNGFERLFQTIMQTRTFGAWETVATRPLVAADDLVTPSISARPYAGDGPLAGPMVQGDKIQISVRDVGPNAQVIGKQIQEAHYHINQIIHQDDPVVQQLIQESITAALRDCLVTRTTTRQVVFMLNTWHQATTEIRNWLCRNLLCWIAERKLPKAAAVVAGEKMTDIGRPLHCVGPLELPGLPPEAVRTYWIKKRGLPSEEVSDAIKYSGGVPLVLALMADQTAIRISRQGEG